MKNLWKNYEKLKKTKQNWWKTIKTDEQTMKNYEKPMEI